jgi:hypothetical protein
METITISGNVNNSNIFCDKDEITIFKQPPKYSELIFGETHYFTEAKFNKLQKRMWKKLLGIEIKDIK